MQEFTVAGAFRSDRRGAEHWILSHLRQHAGFAAWLVLASVAANALTACVPFITGATFNEVLSGEATRRGPALTALLLLGLVLSRALIGVSARYAAEFLGKRLARDAREELSRALLSAR